MKRKERKSFNVRKKKKTMLCFQKEKNNEKNNEIRKLRIIRQIETEGRVLMLEKLADKQTHQLRPK